MSDEERALIAALKDAATRKLTTATCAETFAAFDAAYDALRDYRAKHPKTSVRRQSEA